MVILLLNTYSYAILPPQKIDNMISVSNTFYITLHIKLGGNFGIRLGIQNFKLSFKNVQCTFNRILMDCTLMEYEYLNITYFIFELLLLTAIKIEICNFV